MLVAVAGFAPVRVVAILLAPARISPGGLQVPARVGADPDIFVRRRNGELRDARQRARVADRPPAGPDIVEFGWRFLSAATRAATAHAADAARLVADVDETFGNWRHGSSLRAGCRCRCRRRSRCSTFHDGVVRQPLTCTLFGVEEA